MTTTEKIYAFRDRLVEQAQQGFHKDLRTWVDSQSGAYKSLTALAEESLDWWEKPAEPWVPISAALRAEAERLSEEADSLQREDGDLSEEDAVAEAMLLGEIRGIRRAVAAVDAALDVEIAEVLG